MCDRKSEFEMEEFEIEFGVWSLIVRVYRRESVMCGRENLSEKQTICKQHTSNMYPPHISLIHKK